MEIIRFLKVIFFICYEINYSAYIKIIFNYIWSLKELSKDIENENNKKEIFSQTNFMVDAIESTPKTNSILFTIKKYCILKYDLNNFTSNVNTLKKKFTFDWLLFISELLKKLFIDYLDKNNIFELSNKIMVIFDFFF